MSGALPRPGNKSGRSGFAVSISRQLRKADFKILYGDQRHKREGLSVTPSDDRARISFDYDRYHEGHQVLFDDLVKALEGLGYSIERHQDPESWSIYVSKKETAPVSKVIYRANTRLHALGKPRANSWACSHQHKTAETAAKCGQVELRRHLADARTKPERIVWLEATAYVAFQSEHTAGNWFDLIAWVKQSGPVE